MMSSWQTPLAAALARRREAGVRPAFWWRDDDAIRPTPALDRLLAVSAEHGVAPVCAVIPHGAGEQLAARLDRADGVCVAVHGIAHRNRASAGEKKIELNAVGIPDTLAALTRGHLKLQTLFGSRCVPILVPPWNRISPELVAALPGCGFKVLSCYGDREAAAGIFRVNTHLDLIDWRGGRGLRDPHILGESLVRCLSVSSGEPVGILTHHLVHDSAAWEFLSDLLSVLLDGGAEFLGGHDIVAMSE